MVAAAMRGWGLVASVLALGALGSVAARDTEDGPRGVERVEDQLQAQGRNTSADRAYGHWAQEDKNLTGAANANWITVADAIAYAKKTWNVTITDETGDATVGKVKFCIAVGDVGREMALPIFLEALTMAVQGARQECYVEVDEHDRFYYSPKNWHRSKVHIRKARPLQPAPDTAKAPLLKEAPAKAEAKPEGSAGTAAVTQVAAGTK